MLNILFYFNSTIAQCMAALLALTGMFAVYRIQVQGNKLNRTMDAAKEFAFNTALIHDHDAKMWLDYSIKENLIRYKEKLIRDEKPDIEVRQSIILLIVNWLDITWVLSGFLKPPTG